MSISSPRRYRAIGMQTPIRDLQWPKRTALASAAPNKAPLQYIRVTCSTCKGSNRYQGTFCRFCGGKPTYFTLAGVEITAEEAIALQQAANQVYEEQQESALEQARRR